MKRPSSVAAFLLLGLLRGAVSGALSGFAFGIVVAIQVAIDGDAKSVEQAVGIAIYVGSIGLIVGVDIGVVMGALVGTIAGLARRRFDRLWPLTAATTFLITIGIGCVIVFGGDADGRLARFGGAMLSAAVFATVAALASVGVRGEGGRKPAPS